MLVAIVNYAGGCAEYRLEQNDDGTVTSRHFYADVSDGPNEGNMVEDKHVPARNYDNLVNAMSDIAHKISN